MPVFFVTALTDPAKVKAAVQAADSTAYELKQDSWFLKYAGTSQELAEKLGIVSGVSGTGVVLPVTNYGGRAAADVWEWLKLRLSQPG